MGGVGGVGGRASSWDVGRGAWAPLKKAIFQCISAIFQSSYPKHKAIFQIKSKLGRIPSINCSGFTVFISQFIVYVSQLEFLHPKSLIQLGLGASQLHYPSQIIDWVRFGTRPKSQQKLLHYPSQVIVSVELGTRPKSQTTSLSIPSHWFSWAWDASQVPTETTVLHYPSQVIDRLGLGRVPIVFSPRVGFGLYYTSQVLLFGASQLIPSVSWDLFQLLLRFRPKCCP